MSANMFFPIFVGSKSILIATTQEENEFWHLHGSWMYFGKVVVTHTTNHEFDSLWYSKFDGVS
jgi:hypothetical protein